MEGCGGSMVVEVGVRGCVVTPVWMGLVPGGGRWAGTWCQVVYKALEIAVGCGVSAIRGQLGCRLLPMRWVEILFWCLLCCEEVGVEVSRSTRRLIQPLACCVGVFPATWCWG